MPGTERQQRGTGDSLASSADGSVPTGRKLPTAQPNRPGIARAQSMKVLIWPSFFSHVLLCMKLSCTQSFLKADFVANMVCVSWSQQCMLDIYYK